MKYICEIEDNISDKTIIILAGRDCTAKEMLQAFKNLNYRKIAIQPVDEWYAIPNGIDDQQAAVVGIKNQVSKLNYFVKQLEVLYSVKRNNIVLLGYSAGAVMALQLAVNSKEEFAAVICYKGAILNTESLPQANNFTKYILMHSRNDSCFKWHERYLPMKKSLIEKNYNCDCLEWNDGEHAINSPDINIISALIQNIS